MTEVSITPEMISAGSSALFKMTGSDPLFDPPSSEIVTEVFLAMLGACDPAPRHFRDAPHVKLSEAQMSRSLSVLREWDYEAADESEERKLVRRIAAALCGKELLTHS